MVKFFFLHYNLQNKPTVQLYYWLIETLKIRGFETLTGGGGEPPQIPYRAGERVYGSLYFKKF